MNLEQLETALKYFDWWYDRSSSLTYVKSHARQLLLLVDSAEKLGPAGIRLYQQYRAKEA
jgi:hypothetical protein